MKAEKEKKTEEKAEKQAKETTQTEKMETLSTTEEIMKDEKTDKQAGETSGEITGKEVSEEKLDKLIRHHVYGAVAVGLLPVPLADFAGLTVVQLNLLRKLAQLYNIPFSKGLVKNILSSMVGGALPTAVSGPLAVSISKFIPAIGTTAGVVTMPIVAGATTYAVGKVFVQHFASGGTFLTFNPEKVKAYYTEMFKEGEKVAASVKS
ncbi:YcjF family protein [Desulfonema magnum]|uniref:DUF697 n=1 Tax=Desulfonema magnum TaxID=45655 RepID=A0A975BPZ3_9BACT|nr:DUF697 domain-containing protein [Desulfonema magnum]QTA89719.1 DUF697 [Desulfonema magnum]